MIIRQERPEDYDTVYHVVKEAFENAEYTDGNEQNLVAALRKSKSFMEHKTGIITKKEKYCIFRWIIIIMRANGQLCFWEKRLQNFIEH